MSAGALDFALRYAGAGYRVMPVRGKIPLTEHGSHDATTDEATIRAWWSRWPDANIGMTLDGLVAIDIDPRNGGDVDKLPALPDTCYARTGGGGLHYLFRAHNGTKYPGTLGAGIDCKSGAGAYLVVEPSLHASGSTYCWLDESEPWTTKPAEAPEWLAKSEAIRKAEAGDKPGAVGLLRNITAGAALHDSLRDLAAHFATKGLPYEEIREQLEVTMRQSEAPRDDRWKERFNDIPKLVHSAIQKFASDEKTTTAWPEPIDLAALSEREPQQPQFIVPDWLPAGYATLLAGHGGVGKSAVALHLAVCIAMGLPWAGIECASRRVLYLSCEDREGVLHWRLDRICRHLGISLAELVGKLDIVELVGHDSILWERDLRTGNCVTSALGRLEERMRTSETAVLIVDGISDTYGGNENARGEVKRYVNALLALVPVDRGALLLVGHVNRPTAANGATREGYSGSTAWHNAVRSRLYLYPETAQSDEGARPERTGRLMLELQKSNLGPTDQCISWKWDDDAHMFLPEAAPSEFDRKHRDREEQRGILLALRGCAAASIIVPAAMQGPKTAHHVLKLRPEMPESLRSGKPAVRRFWRQIEQMRQIRKIEEREYRRPNKHLGTQLVLTTEGERHIAE